MSLDDPEDPRRADRQQTRPDATPPPVRPGAAPPPDVPDDVDRPPSGSERARAMLLPVSDDGPDRAEDAGIRPVLPGRPQPPAPPSRPAVAADEHGLVCWRCGVGNNPERIFCRNCAADLRNPPRPVAAPPPRRSNRRALVIIAVVVAVGALLAAAVLLVGPIIRALRDGQDDDLVAAAPDRASASSFDPRQPPRLAFDGSTDTAWATGRPGPPNNATIQGEFNEPVDVREVRIVPVATGRSEQARPERIDLVIFNAQGRRTSSQHRLEDRASSTISADVDSAVRVQVIVRSAFGVAADRQVAIAEITVFRPAS